MTDRNVRRCAVIGLVVTVALCALTFSIGGLHLFEHRYSISAEFASAAGIGAGDPVRVAGVEVGSVSKVERMPRDGLVRVKLSVDKKTWLADGTKASVRLRTLLGSRFVALDTPQAGKRMAAGSTIPVSRTETPVELDETLDALDAVAKPFDVNAMNRLVGSFAKGLDGHAPRVNSMLHDLASLSGAIAARKGDLDKLIAATHTLAGAVDDRSVQLGTSIDSFATILDTLAARRQQLTDLVGGVTALSDRLTPLLAKNQGTIDSTLGQLVQAVQAIDSQRGRLDLVLGNLPEFAKRLVKVTDDGSFINVYYVGTIPGPYPGDPIDLGDAKSNEPGEDGGLPRIWVQPPVQPPSGEVGGTKVDGQDHTPPPPSPAQTDVDGGQ